MIKKFLSILLICLCAGPVFAQKKLEKLRHILTPSTAQIQRRVTHVFKKHAAVSPQVLTPLPVKPPLVFVRHDLQKPLTANELRLLTGADVTAKVFPTGLLSGQFYAPVSLPSLEPVAYRGMSLKNLEELRYLLTNGMEVSKVSYSMSGKIFFSGSMYVAGLFARHAKEQLAVVVKFKAPEDISLYHAQQSYYTQTDIPPTAIKEVFVFLEVQGKPGWYKAALQDGQLTLTPAPSKLYKQADLIEHTFEVPLEKINWY